MAFVSLMLEWLKHGRIKHLIFSGESSFCRGPDCLWVRVRRGVSDETATITEHDFPAGFMVFGAIRVGFKRTLIRYSKGVDSGGCVVMVLFCGLPELPLTLYGESAWAFQQDGARCHTRERTMSALQ
jgi:hypothetical protein